MRKLLCYVVKQCCCFHVSDGNWLQVDGCLRNCESDGIGNMDDKICREGEYLGFS